MTTLKARIENKHLLAKVVPVEEAVKLVPSRCTMAISGFTKSGEPKAFLPALARHLAAAAPDTKIGLFSGASLSEDVENLLSPFIEKRAPYMSSSTSRKLIHSGQMDFADVHLSQFGRNLMYGFYGDINLAVVEVSRVRADGSVVLSSSVGISPEALTKAKKVILEVNTAIPDYTGFHDILVPSVHPNICWPIPLTNVSDRIGTHYVEFDTRKVVAVVESRIPDHANPFRSRRT
jgi:acyl-CoA hydrolase